jgi:predicted secreted protein
MTSSGFAAKGTTLTWNGSLIGEITNMQGPSPTADEIDITNHDSTGDYKEFVPGLKDGGSMTFDNSNFVPNNAGQAAIIAGFNASPPTTAAFTVTFPDSGHATLTGNAFVKSFGFGAPVAGKASFTFTLRVTGAVTMTP